MCLAQEPQHSDAGEARTHGLSISSQALYHWATALPWSDGMTSSTPRDTVRQIKVLLWYCVCIKRSTLNTGYYRGYYMAEMCI